MPVSLCWSRSWCMNTLCQLNPSAPGIASLKATLLGLILALLALFHHSKPAKPSSIITVERTTLLCRRHGRREEPGEDSMSFMRL